MVFLQNNEGIEIKLELEQSDLLIQIDGKDYASMSNVYDIDDLNLNDLKDWIIETYYDHDFDYGLINYLNADNFQK